MKLATKFLLCFNFIEKGNTYLLEKTLGLTSEVSQEINIFGLLITMDFECLEKFSEAIERDIFQKK